MLLILSSISPIWANATLGTPAIELSPQTGPAGTAVAVSGSGFVPASIVTITFGGGSVDTSPKTVIADALGNFEATFNVPHSAEAGTYPVVAKSLGPIQAQAESSFQVAAPNSRPVADSQSVTLKADETIEVTLRGSDPDGDPIAFSIVDQPTHGTVENMNSTTGTLTYVPTADYHGKDRFTFKVNDGRQDSFLAEVSITVQESGDTLAMEDMQVEVQEDSEIVIFLTAGDGDSSSLSFEIVDRPAHGSLGELRPYDRDSAYVTYTPSADFNGTDFFTARASDSRQQSEIATVSIQILPVQDIPSAYGARFDALQGESIPIALAASDPDGDSLAFILLTLPAHGILAGTAPSLNYLPDSDYRGWDKFTFKVNDGSADSNVARIEILVPASTPAEEDAAGAGESSDTTPSEENSATDGQDPPVPETEETEQVPLDGNDSGQDIAEPAAEETQSNEPVDSPAQDTTPPRLVIPASPLLFESETELGTAVTYNIAAFDDRDGEVVPECSPASGYTFPVGRVNVVCKAADSSGNIAVGSFVVEVKPLQTSDSPFGLGQFRLADYWQPILASAILSVAGIAVYVGLRAKRASARNSPQQTAAES